MVSSSRPRTRVSVNRCRTSDRVRLPLSSTSGKGKRPVPGNRGIDSIQRIEFDSVSFSYRPSSPILRDVSFAVEAGEAIGGGGPVRSGKVNTRPAAPPTSRAHNRKLSREWHLLAFEIEDGVWHRSVTYLPQEPHLRNTTVEENIGFHRGWVSDKAIERAARLAHVDSEIMSWGKRVPDHRGTKVRCGVRRSTPTHLPSAGAGG